MNQMLETAPVADSPQHHLGAILEHRQPGSVLVVSLNPVPVVEEWCRHHDAALTVITEPDPLPLLQDMGRVDLAIVADQLEYMDRQAGEVLLGRLRNLHTEAMIVLYQATLAPQRLRWALDDFYGMGLRRERVFTSAQREMSLFTYELASYNFVRQWNNPRFWANPENWGRYWW